MNKGDMLSLESLNLNPESRPLLEKDIENAVCKHAKNKYGMLAEKFTSPSKRSVPDRIFTCKQNCIFFIEFKAPGKKPTLKQQSDHEKRRNMGVRVYVVDNIEEGKKIIDEEYANACLSY